MGSPRAPQQPLPTKTSVQPSRSDLEKKKMIKGESERKRTVPLLVEAALRWQCPHPRVLLWAAGAQFGAGCCLHV